MTRIRCRLIYIILLIFLFIPYTFGDDLLSLSLEDCILKTLDSNLSIVVERYNPQLAVATLSQAREVFLPQFDLSYGMQNTEEPPYWWIQGQGTQETEYSNYSVEFSQLIPTGGSFSFSLSSYKSDTNQSFQLINPRYGSTLRLDFTQPLLKNFGYRISRKDILLARNNVDISQNQLQSVVLEKIYQVQEAYWNLVYAIEDHKVKQQSLQLGRDLLSKNQKEVEVGKLAPIEILNAETVVATREAEILQAEALIRSQEDALKAIMNISGEDLFKRITTLDEPQFFKRDVSLEAALQEAFLRRPDLKISEINSQSKNLELSVARNQLLPSLDLTFSYWSPGISGDRILYQDNNPFLGIIIGTEEGGARGSIQDALNLLYKNWFIGLTLSLPVSNLISRANFTRAQIEMNKSLVELENARQIVQLEVRDIIRSIETNAKRVKAYRLARKLAEQRLEAEVKKLKVGLTTNYFVLEFQEQLANAKSQEIRALIDYNLSLAALEKVTGNSLEKMNIEIK